jgi:hypothetical protein
MISSNLRPLTKYVLNHPGPSIGRIVGLASFRYLREAVLDEVAFDCRHFNEFWYVALESHIPTMLTVRGGCAQRWEASQTLRICSTFGLRAYYRCRMPAN